MKKLIIMTAILAVAAFPVLSSACHVTEVNGDANCEGWNLCTSVYFTSGTDQGSLEYTVTILDGSGDEVTSFGEILTITHEPGEGTYEYCFDGLWEGVYQVAEATVVLTSSLDGQAPTVFTFDLNCSVGTDRTSIDQLKANYR
jgi:hypothetical protein